MTTPVGGHPGRVEGKVALVTGMARGQGRSHALLLAEHGADIIGIDVPTSIDTMNYPLSDQDDLDETVRLIEKTGRRVVACSADVRDKHAIASAVESGVKELGRLDIVIANAGICPMGPLPVQTFFDVVEVDLVGVLNTFSVGLQYLDDGASMIATGSVGGITPGAVDDPRTGPGGVGYVLAKRTLAQLVRDLSVLLAPRKIRVNAIHPTNVNTPLLQNEGMWQLFRPDLESPTEEDAFKPFHFLQAMPIPYIDPIDVSQAVLFLASDESRYVTGTQMRVDAGAVAKQQSAPM